MKKNVIGTLHQEVRSQALAQLREVRVGGRGGVQLFFDLFDKAIFDELNGLLYPSEKPSGG